MRGPGLAQEGRVVASGCGCGCGRKSVVREAGRRGEDRRGGVRQRSGEAREGRQGLGLDSASSGLAKKWLAPY